MWLYILDDKRRVVPIDSFEKWSEWLQANIHNRNVAVTELDDGTYIMTVFLAHSSLWSDKKNPYTFQTMVIGDKHNIVERYYVSWEEAEKGHEEIVQSLLDNHDPIWPAELEEKEDEEICTKCNKVINGSVFVCGTTAILCWDCMIQHKRERLELK